MKKVKLAVVGVGNCASSLIQGIEYYRHHHNEHSDGIMQPQINGWRPQDIKIVAAFDIDSEEIDVLVPRMGLPEKFDKRTIALFPRNVSWVKIYYILL